MNVNLVFNVVYSLQVVVAFVILLFLSVFIQLLFQETNPGVRYGFIVKKNSSAENDLLEPQYIWKYGAWTDCSVSCGQGDNNDNSNTAQSTIRELQSVKHMQ